MFSMQTVILKNLEKLFQRIASQFWTKNHIPYQLVNSDCSMTYASNVFVIEVNLVDPTSWVLDTGCGSHICTDMSGLKDSRVLANGEVDLRVGNGASVSALSIGTYLLTLPSGLVLELENCYHVLL